MGSESLGEVSPFLSYHIQVEKSHGGRVWRNLVGKKVMICHDRPGEARDFGKRFYAPEEV